MIMCIEGDRILPVSRNVAKDIGLREAIVLSQLGKWVMAEGQKKEGSEWIHMSTKDMMDNGFPFWSINTINTALQAIKKLGLVEITTRFNDSKFDRVRWFALTDAGKEKLQ